MTHQDFEQERMLSSRKRAKERVIAEGELSVTQVVRHRNGIMGEPFDVVKFQDEDHGEMVAIVFPTEEGQKYNGRVSVFNLELLAQGNITFGENSWRGDTYEHLLRKAIEKEYA